jgi:hypothetical protein
MAASPEQGMTTAEYAVGTLGICAVALVLHELATDGYWFDRITDIFVRALAWRNILDGFPVPSIGRR